jgi:peptidoglycan-N-acetylglucosamine deacetylase
MLLAIYGMLVLVVLVSSGIFFCACSVPSSRIFKPVVIRGPEEGRRIVLSFDDGPAPPFTEQILDILREKKVPAVFFVCGQNVDRYPEIARRIVAEGHTLGNHTYSHPFLYFRSQAWMADEIDRTQEVVEKATGVRPWVFRPPYGVRWPGLMSVLGRRGIKLVMWSATGFDWKCKTDEIIRNILRSLGPGSVILLHDGRAVLPADQFSRSDTVAALSRIIDQAREAGLTFVPLAEFVSP